nr:MAG TPA: Putative transferase, nesg, ydcK, Structural Genomics.38A [Caudoviricetes sp.]
MKKFEFTGENKVWYGYTLRRIRALVDIPTHCVKKGDLGGWIEKNKNLSHDGNAQVYTRNA